MEYRSLDFQYTREPKRGHFQINECNRENAWTRTVDHSHWLDQSVETTVIGREFPCEWDGTNVRFYPKPFGGVQTRAVGGSTGYSDCSDPVVRRVM
jgi:UDP-galactopyranose mutase